MSAREHCYVCDKVASLCICERVPSVQNRTEITIVQHPRERRHPFGTTRIARLGLQNVTVHVASDDAAALRLPSEATLLFPDSDAPLLSALPAERRPAHLVAIDGTWSQAAQLRRTHPALAPLPAVRLAPEAPSRYRIRREPNEQAVSTIEAVVRALRILEPDTPGLDLLLSSFDAMIDDQLVRRGQHPFSPRHRHTKREKRALPEVFRFPSRDVVLLYAELHQPRGQQLRFPLRVTAARPEPREVVDALLKSPLPASPPRVRNMGLGAVSFDDAITPAELAELLGGLVRAEDTLIAWAQSPEPVLRSLGFEQPFLSAKHYFANQRDGRMGTLDDVVERLGGSALAPWAEGRAGRQLAQLDFVVSAMRALAATDPSRQ